MCRFSWQFLRGLFNSPPLSSPIRAGPKQNQTETAKSKMEKESGMESIRHSTVSVNGINMHVAEKGEGPVVLFIHGFPELWYSWRHQILDLASRGYRKEIGNGIVMQEPGEIEAEFAKIGTERVMTEFLTYHTPKPLMLPKGKGFGHPLDTPIPLPPWLSHQDIQYYASKFDTKGFTAPINYYRNLDRNWELNAPFTGAQVKVPVKFIVGDLDLSYNSFGTKEYINSGEMKKDVPFLEEVVVMEGVGHFLQEEKPREISDHIYQFITKF
ncbi:uncharacterized protein LOC111009320 [Momordica charantia]|uniref:Uncharacterized protein LOC111009320 n=1 Tax=Momordica charantia TaxID=3673 RepID=A0A6J1C8M9_MOMCH|nr:uncharacterized protein LOC111009320 [Momordica charantia]